MNTTYFSMIIEFILYLTVHLLKLACQLLQKPVKVKLLFTQRFILSGTSTPSNMDTSRKNLHIIKNFTYLNNFLLVYIHQLLLLYDLHKIQNKVCSNANSKRCIFFPHSMLVDCVQITVSIFIKVINNNKINIKNKYTKDTM